MIDAPTRPADHHRGNGRNGTGPTWLDRRREHLRSWLPPILYDVLGAAPSREFLRWLWGKDYDLAGVTPKENWIILHAVMIGDLDEGNTPTWLRKRLASALSGQNEVPGPTGNIVCRALDAMEQRPGYIRPKDMNDTEFEELLQWLDSDPL